MRQCYYLLEVLGGIFSPSSDSQSVSVGAKLLLEISFLVYSGGTAAEYPGVNCETFPEVDLHYKDASTKDVMSKKGRLI
jgi:hypothetical protein